MSLAAEDEPKVHRLHGRIHSMDVDKDTRNVSNISGPIPDAPECNISASPLQNQADVKETSSYGKSNFVLPVTFFDIQSNLILLNECCPLAIKVVDCDKHPWYYKKYTRSVIRSESVKMTEDPSNNNISQNCVSIDLTESKYDKFEKIEAIKVEKDKSRKSKESKKKRADYVGKTKQTTNRRRNELKKIALNNMDLTNIDYKKNIGLIGLKITFKAGVLDNQNEQNETNAMQMHSMESSVKQSTSNSTEGDNFMSEVDKNLCSLGTTIIPIFETQNAPRSSDTKILEDASISSEKPLTKSATIVQISKKKLSKKAFYKNKPKKKSTKKNLFNNNDNSFGVGNYMNAQVQCQDNENQPLTSPLPDIKEHSNNQFKKNQNLDKIKDILKKVEKELTNFTKKSNAQLLEAHDMKTKNTEMIRENKFRSKSPILFCHIYNNNKLKSHSYLQPRETNQPYKRETKGEKADNEFKLRNTQVKLVRDLGNHNNPRGDAKKVIEEEPQHSADIPAVHNKHASAVANTSQNVTKNVGHISPIDMDKVKFNNTSKSRSTFNTNVKNEIKPAYKHQYTPSPYLLSKQNDTSKPLDGTNENTILLSAVQTDKKISLQNNVALSQPKQPPVENASNSNTNIQRVNRENSNTPCRSGNENNLANVRDNNNQQIRHVLPLQIQSSERGNYRKGEPSRLPNIFPIQRIPPLVSHQVSPVSAVLYNNSNAPRSYDQIPNFYQKNMQQNLPQNVNIPNVNTNPYWSYWYHTHVPPPPLPPPPPPPPPPYESLRQVRRAEASNIINDNSQFNDKMKTYVGLKIKSIAELTNAKPVTSKNETFQELEKETLKINSDISSDNLEKEIQSFPSTTYSHVNIQIPVSKQTFIDKDKKPHTGSKDLTKSSMHQVAHLTHIVPSQWKGENNTRQPKNDLHPNKEHTTANSLSKDHVQVISRKTLLQQPDKSPTKTEIPKPTNRPKVGPLCMKNKTGPFARYQTPPLSLSNSQPNMGYSPPILPIPTFEKSLEMLSQTNYLKRRHGNDRKSLNTATTLQQESDEVQTKSNQSNRRIEYFYVDNEEKSLKKISLQDYKKRIAKGDDKCIVLKKHNSCKRAKRNQSSDQDLGYDSDVTVKL